MSPEESAENPKSGSTKAESQRQSKHAPWLLRATYPTLSVLRDTTIRWSRSFSR